MKQHLPRARIRRGSGIRHEFGERTTAVEEGGPEGGPAEAGGGRGCREPQARRRSPNLHRFGRGSSRERNGEWFFSSLFLLGISIRSISEGWVRVEKRGDGKRKRSRVGVEWFPGETVESWKLLTGPNGPSEIYGEAQYIDKLWVDLIQPNCARFWVELTSPKPFSLGTKSAYGFCNLLTSQWILQFVN